MLALLIVEKTLAGVISDVSSEGNCALFCVNKHLTKGNVPETEVRCAYR